jgi:hypothetical protein
MTMIRTQLVMACGLSVLGTLLPLGGAEGIQEKGLKQSFEVTTIEHIKFAPGGTIRVNDSYGYLSVDGWDEPEVEITLTKSTNGLYQPSGEEAAKARLERIRVATERRSDSELAITTIHASRVGKWVPPLPPTTQARVTTELRIHTPRDSRLVIHHDTGYIWVSDITSDIEVTSHTGDMIVMLPDPGLYSIDARTALGTISSDFIGMGRNRFLFGNAFNYSDETQWRRIYLRMSRGSITVKKGPPLGAYGKN